MVVLDAKKGSWFRGRCVGLPQGVAAICGSKRVRASGLEFLIELEMRTHQANLARGAAFAVRGNVTLSMTSG